MQQYPYLKSSKILIVDDEIEIVEILSEELTKHGALVTKATDAVTAAALFDTQKFDLIISDIRMPGADGIELLKAVKSFDIDRPYFIIMTGFADISPEETADFGVIAHFAKPFKLVEILTTVNHALAPRDVRWKKREHFRHGLVLQAEVSLVGQKFISTKIFNLGRGGFFTAHDDAMPKVDDMVDFKITLQQTPPQFITGQGKIKWCREEANTGFPRGFGVEFISLEPESQKVIEELATKLNTISYIPRR